jgi:hypothetical protein
VYLLIVGATRAAAQRASKYFVGDPEKACVLVPNFEHTLASNELGTPLVIARTLRSLPTWERYGGAGKNLSLNVVCRVLTCKIYARLQPPAVQ